MLFLRYMDVSPPEEETIPGKEGRELHMSVTCALEASPFVEKLPNLCLLAPLLLTTSSAFQIAMSDVSLFISLLSALPQSFRGASSSCTSPTPPSHSCKLAISPNTWEPYGKESLGDEAPLESSSICKDTRISLPLVLLGSFQLLALRHSCMTSLTSHSFHYAVLLSGCLNPPAIQP